MSEPILITSILVLYGISILGHFVAVWKNKDKRLIPQVFHAITVVAFSLYLVQISYQQAHCPFANGREALIFSTWILTIFLFINDILCGRRSMAVFLLPVAFLMSSIGLLIQSKSSWPATDNPNALLPLHVALVMCSYILYLLTALLCFLYWKTISDLKEKKIGFFFSRVPSLKTQEREISRLLWAANILLPIGIIFGKGWIHQEGAQNSIFFEYIISLSAWCIFMLLALFRHKVSARKQSLIAAAGVVVLAMIHLVGQHGT